VLKITMQFSDWKHKSYCNHPSSQALPPTLSVS
jgi:hypothetical protein